MYKFLSLFFVYYIYFLGLIHHPLFFLFAFYILNRARHFSFSKCLLKTNDFLAIYYFFHTGIYVQCFLQHFVGDSLQSSWREGSKENRERLQGQTSVINAGMSTNKERLRRAGNEASLVSFVLLGGTQVLPHSTPLHPPPLCWLINRPGGWRDYLRRDRGRVRTGRKNAQVGKLKITWPFHIKVRIHGEK